MEKEVICISSDDDDAIVIEEVRNKRKESFDKIPAKKIKVDNLSISEELSSKLKNDQGFEKIQAQSNTQNKINKPLSDENNKTSKQITPTCVTANDPILPKKNINNSSSEKPGTSKEIVQSTSSISICNDKKLPTVEDTTEPKKKLVIPTLVVKEKKVIQPEIIQTPFSRFISICVQKDPSNDMQKIIDKLKKKYEQVDPLYAKSETLNTLLTEKYAKINQDSNVYLHIKVIMDELKKAPKRKNEEEYSEVNEETEEQRKRRRNVTKILRAMELCEKRIKKLEETEVDFSDEDDSHFMQMNRYKKRIVDLYNAYCKLTGTVTDAARPYLRPKHIASTHIPLVDQAIMNFINSKISKRNELTAKGRLTDVVIFPDYQDILQCIAKCNEKQNLKLNTNTQKKIAENAFKEIGKYLQRMRREDYWDTFSLYLESSDEDPALRNPELAHKLMENKKLGDKRLNDKFEEYVKLQSGLSKEELEIQMNDDGKSDLSNDEDGTETMEEMSEALKSSNKSENDRVTTDDKSTKNEKSSIKLISESLNKVKEDDEDEIKMLECITNNMKGSISAGNSKVSHLRINESTGKESLHSKEQSIQPNLETKQVLKTSEAENISSNYKKVQSPQVKKIPTENLNISKNQPGSSVNPEQYKKFSEASMKKTNDTTLNINKMHMIKVEQAAKKTSVSKMSPVRAASTSSVSASSVNNITPGTSSESTSLPSISPTSKHQRNTIIQKPNVVVQMTAQHTVPVIDSNVTSHPVISKTSTSVKGLSLQTQKVVTSPKQSTIPDRQVNKNSVQSQAITVTKKSEKLETNSTSSKTNNQVARGKMINPLAVSKAAMKKTGQSVLRSPQQNVVRNPKHEIAKTVPISGNIELSKAVKEISKFIPNTCSGDSDIVPKNIKVKASLLAKTEDKKKTAQVSTNTNVTTFKDNVPVSSTKSKGKFVMKPTNENSKTYKVYTSTPKSICGDNSKTTTVNSVKPMCNIPASILQAMNSGIGDKEHVLVKIENAAPSTEVNTPPQANSENAVTKTTSEVSKDAKTSTSNDNISDVAKPCASGSGTSKDTVQDKTSSPNEVKKFLRVHNFAKLPESWNKTSPTKTDASKESKSSSKSDGSSKSDARDVTVQKIVHRPHSGFKQTVVNQSRVINGRVVPVVQVKNIINNFNFNSGTDTRRINITSGQNTGYRTTTVKPQVSRVQSNSEDKTKNVYVQLPVVTNPLNKGMEQGMTSYIAYPVRNPSTPNSNSENVLHRVTNNVVRILSPTKIKGAVLVQRSASRDKTN